MDAVSPSAKPKPKVLAAGMAGVGMAIALAVVDVLLKQQVIPPAFAGLVTAMAAFVGGYLKRDK